MVFDEFLLGKLPFICCTSGPGYKENNTKILPKGATNRNSIQYFLLEYMEPADPFMIDHLKYQIHNTTQ